MHLRHGTIIAFSLILIVLILTTMGSCSQELNQPWVLYETEDGQSGYVNENGEVMIPPGKYVQCHSDTFMNYGIVYDAAQGLIAIDRGQKVLFEVFPYDNGPDYPSEGLFRIVLDGKIGYADLEGKVLIEPRYLCAFPFENGKAKVAFDCITVQGGEHERWDSGDWFFVDRNGNQIKEESTP